MASKAVNALRSELDVIDGQIKEINAEYEDNKLPDEIRERWNRLNRTRDEYDKKIEILVRQERVEDLSRSEEQTENGDGAQFEIRRPGAFRGDPFDLSTVERDPHDPTKEGHQLRDRARSAIEEKMRFPHPSAEGKERQEDIKHHLTTLIETDTEDAGIARHALITGSDAYRTAWGKYVAGSILSPEEGRVLNSGSARALSLTGSAGGFAVPLQLDPTIIPTSNLAVNPFRSIARIVQTNVDNWNGVSAGSITASYAAEATASSDNAPTLAQPAISTEKAQAFIPFSIEVGMDWSGLQTEIAALLQDAKDELEATKFAVGSGTNEPQGVITGATVVVTASGTASFAYADLDSLEAALPARFRPRASIVMNRSIAQRVRHFDTAGAQTSVWNQGVQLESGLPTQAPTPGSYRANILGYPAYEASAMASVLTTGSLIAVLGDFRYFVIVDRIGLTVETIPHLFDVTNNRPTGQRGLYAYWRNSSGVLSTAAFRVLKTG